MRASAWELDSDCQKVMVERDQMKEKVMELDNKLEVAEAKAKKKDERISKR